MLILIQPPASNIKLVRSLISGVTISVIPVHMLLVLSIYVIIRRGISMSQPHIIMLSFLLIAIRRYSIRILWFETYSTFQISLSDSSVMLEFIRFYHI